MAEQRIFELGDFPLQLGGVVLPDARLAYITLGELNAARDNVVLCPTWFTGVPADTAAVMTGPGPRARPRALVHRHPGPLRRRRVLLAVEHGRRPGSGAASRASRRTTTCARSTAC